jgi:hypothetical protein
MTQDVITYIFIWVIALFVILAFAIWLKKMIKIILWNYILWGICFAASASIDLAISTSTNDWFIWFMTSGKSIIVLILYIALLALIYYKSKITIDIPTDQIIQKSLYLFLVPMTVLSMCLTVEIVLLGTNILSYNSLLLTVEWFTKNIYVQQLILNTPYLVLLHWLATVIITSELKTKIRTDISSL